MKTITIDGKRFFWRDILALRREQKKAARQKQLRLFDMKLDVRPASQSTATRRFEEPTLFGEGF